MFIDTFYDFEIAPEWREMANAILWLMTMSNATETELQIMAYMLRKFCIQNPKPVTSNES